MPWQSFATTPRYNLSREWAMGKKQAWSLKMAHREIGDNHGVKQVLELVKPGSWIFFLLTGEQVYPKVLNRVYFDMPRRVVNLYTEY